MDILQRHLQSIHDSLINEKSKAMYSSMANVLIDSSVGGLVFFTGISTTQALQYQLGISASHRALASPLGILGVLTSSSLCIALAPWPRKLYTSNTPFALQLEPLQVVSSGILGLGLFRLARGRFFALAPSDYRNRGAFSRYRASLPATLDYADTTKRAVISAFGKLFGCHTCGKQHTAFHADHMPPVNFVKQANAKWWRRLSGMTLTQRYYPQCNSCSNQQGALVKKNVKKLKTHFGAWRAYHLTGFWLTMLCTGGLLHLSDASDSGQEHRMAHVVTDKAMEVLMVPLMKVLDEQENYIKSCLKTERDGTERKRLKRELALVQERKKALRKRFNP